MATEKGQMEADAPTYWSAENSDEEIKISMISKTVDMLKAANPPSVSAWALHDGVSTVSNKEDNDSIFAISREGHNDRVPTNSLLPNLDSMAEKFENLDLVFGDVLQATSTFVPFAGVRMYPFKYVGKKNQPKVADFFKETVLNGYSWDFFSQYYPGTAIRNPLLLVPTFQFIRFLEMANDELDTNLTIPGGAAGKEFWLRFGEWNTPTPRFVKAADNSTAYDEVKILSQTLPLDDLSHLTPTQHQMYCDKMEGIFKSLKFTGYKNTEAARLRRVQKQKNCGRMLKRVQRYLGLRRAISGDIFNKLVPENWDVSKPTPFKDREHVRFVCVDFEAYERSPKTVTEVGLAILDTEEITEVPPGERGENWFSKIQYYHFRIAERLHMINHQWVQGCPEDFNFGESRIVSIKDANRVVGGLIGDKESEDEKPAIMVGHGLQNDLSYLLMIDYNPWSVPHIIDEIDTKDMFQRMERSPQGRGLSKVCAEMGIDGHHYHNAGNDAAYTLQAMIAMAIESKVKGPDREKESHNSGSDDWTDGDIDDGGFAKRSARPTEKTRG
ncbi:hypothetical protein GGS21DRAFT_184121 [Xylaria nigripes]|nr:hypothetical protein GGS21DRAFT_184121 [Xylaria nigripes]